MPVLQLTVRWLAGEGLSAFHGAEWPPSPVRVFRALLAGVHRPGGAGARGLQALERLEQMPPPVIIGPLAHRLEPVTTAVPNNDGDRVLVEYQAGRHDKARRRTSQLKTMRRRQGWQVPTAVQYRWQFPEPDPDPQAYDLLAQGLTLLGQGTDLVAAHADWHDSEPARWGYAWIPTTGGIEGMPVPSPGELERLTQAHADDRLRIQGETVRSAIEPPLHIAEYLDPLGPPPQRWQALSLRSPDAALPWSKTGTEAVQVAGMVRHAIHRAAKLAGLDQQVITELMGHGGEGRINVLPVPNVGHRWADGRVRRVLISAGTAVDQETWEAVTLRLGAMELISEPSGEVEAMLIPAVSVKLDAVFANFLRPATRWTSASPVILPGFDTRRGRTRPAKAAKRLLRHAGIPLEAVRHIELHPAPELAAVCTAQSIQVPRHLRDYPRVFVTLEFHRPVNGPLVLGAGAGLGFGLLIHRERLGGDTQPVERSHDEKAR
ncbi:type I-U CRISPR-associated protein Csb2 [Halomonas sp. M5N1S17]|uniref:type I-G CRISPR-associated protein Csb2 n=1 Tax=Halomonas alkalisoli TaxID=2907158 RepID=UPI001F1CAF4B|nr:type I-U CRISPR-associated protein Csb2 [Halomonas alkalisoli]MCE9664890.1 type I-U CRISPR-associated protein Csb2 [Halomonas alkalisoli]